MSLLFNHIAQYKACISSGTELLCETLPQWLKFMLAYSLHVCLLRMFSYKFKVTNWLYLEQHLRGNFINSHH